MGLIRQWISEMGDTWTGMARGDANAFIGVPKRNPGGTGHGGTGTGHAPSPDHLTERQEQMLMRFFHQRYGRYPTSDFEFRAWLRDNW